MKFFKVLVLLVLAFILSAKGVAAYPGSTDPNAWEQSVYKTQEFNLESHTNETFKNLAFSISGAILGPSDQALLPQTGPGVIAGLGNLIVAMYTNPPASSREYFADLGKNFGLVKPAYAQGIGFSGLSNLLPLWKASRNVAYLFFILIFLFTGLAIMFRIKIDPKTAVTVQNSIPKLVIALILVTFSYAIAGLLIDLIYVLIYVGILVIGRTGLIDVAAEQKEFLSVNFGKVWGLIVGGSGRAAWLSLGELFKSLSLVGTILQAAGTALFVLFFALLAFYLITKLFLSLLASYVTIIVSVIIAPFQILLGALPGSKTGGFSSWFFNLLANILVFPAVAVFLLLAWVLTYQVGPSWTPPVLSVSGSALTPILGLGMLMLISKVPDTIKAAFKIKPALETAIGESLKIGYTGALKGREAFERATHADVRREARRKKEIGDYLARLSPQQAGTPRE
jgi:hypothetical protein